MFKDIEKPVLKSSYLHKLNPSETISDNSQVFIKLHK